MAGQTVNVSVLADTSRFNRGMQSARGGTTSFVGGIKKLIGAFAALKAVQSGIQFGKDAIKAASALEQSVGGVDAVFKGSSGTIHKWAASAADDLGLSENSYNELATVIGSQLKNAGVATDQLAGKTNNLITLGADLAAQFGGPTSDAVGALSSLYKGEFDPIEKYGVSLKQADVNARLAAKGQGKLTGAAKKLAVQTAITELVMEQTTDAQGAWGRESKTLANKQAKLAANVENLKAKIGKKLLPAMAGLSDWVLKKGLPALSDLGKKFEKDVLPKVQALGDVLKDEVLPKVQEFGDFLKDDVVPKLQEFGDFIKEHKDLIGTWAAAVGGMVVALGAWKLALILVTTWQTIAAAATAAWNAVLYANPIGLVVVAVAALVAALAYFFTQTELGQKIVEKVWPIIKSAIATVVDWFQNTAVPAFQAAWEKIKGAFNTAKEIITPLVNDIKQAFIDGKDAIVKAIDDIKAKVQEWQNKWTDLKDSVTVDWGKINTQYSVGGRTVSENLKSVLNVTKTVWSYSPMGQITNNWRPILRFFASIPKAILGNFVGAARLLVWAGRAIVTGLAGGITGAAHMVFSAGRFVIRNIKSYFGGSASWLFNAGKRLISGFADGMIARGNAAYNAAKNIVSKIRGLLPGSPIKTGPLKSWNRGGAGKRLMGLLADGITAGAPTVARAMNRAVSPLNMSPSPDFAGARGGGAGPGAGGYGNTYNITVNALTPNAEVGRVVANAIKDYERMGGR